jgi:transposase InsO family protein
MPWREVSVMDERREFIVLATAEGANRSELCRRFGISRQTGYKWLSRRAAGDEELADRSRRPHTSPGRSSAADEARVVAVRDAHPAWGARKIVRCLERDWRTAPAGSTVHAILRRHGRVAAACGGAGKPWQRFEKPAPNLLWQMDFKGRVALSNGAACHPLTIVDDHSRYAVCLRACGNEQGETVRSALAATFRRYGLPEAMLVDNGSPWGDGPRQSWTRLGVWLLKLGVDVLHSRPYPAARTSASIAPSRRRYSRCNASALSTTFSARSIAGARSTTASGRTRHSGRRCRRAATWRARGRCLRTFRGSNMTTARKCARSAPPRPM